MNTSALLVPNDEYLALPSHVGRAIRAAPWGTFFPVYTNLACIGIVYSVISPLILSSI